jgi:predicted dinucleotide-binding enzyme
MKIAVLGTGMVGQAVATRLAELGHDVTMGSRDAANPKATDWAAGAGQRAAATFADATASAELVVNATSGVATLEALTLAGADNLDGKVLLDIANPLDFSNGFPPSLSVVNTDSLGEQVQRAFPGAKVVKSLNTMNCEVMVDPRRVGEGDHDVFVAGDDAEAKATVTELLRGFGWAPEHIHDLGGIASARGTEMYLPLWLSLMGSLGTGNFNIKVVRG